jgi:hypothetical protein
MHFKGDAPFIYLVPQWDNAFKKGGMVWFFLSNFQSSTWGISSVTLQMGSFSVVMLWHCGFAHTGWILVLGSDGDYFSPSSHLWTVRGISQWPPWSLIVFAISASACFLPRPGVNRFSKKPFQGEVYFSEKLSQDDHFCYWTNFCSARIEFRASCTRQAPFHWATSVLG